MKHLFSAALAFLVIGCSGARAARTDYGFPTPRRTSDFLEITRADELIRIGLSTNDTAPNLNFPAGGTAWTEKGLPVVIPPGTISLVRNFHHIVLSHDSAVATGRSWRFQPAAGGRILYRSVPYRGAFELFPSPPPETSSVAITVVNAVRLEDYLRGVVPKEHGFLRPEHIESMKAQAVAARTYAVRNLGRRAPLGFDLYATQADQAYGGMAAEHELSDRAVSETADEIRVYGEEPIEAFYHSTCGGNTASKEEVWGGNPVPYLRARPDILLDDRACTWSKYYRWSRSYTSDTLSRLLPGSLPVSVEILSRGSSGRIGHMAVRNAETELIAFGDDARRRLAAPGEAPLRSALFEVVKTETGVLIKGGGWGHGVGMCQVGAISRGRSGAGYGEILDFYYPYTRARKVVFRIPGP